MKIISLGWGVQSFTLAAMVALGELEPVDVAIHADTTHESALTYDFAGRWTPWLAEREVRVVTVNDATQAAKAATKDTDAPFYTYKVVEFGGTPLPAYIANEGKGMLMRQCTNRWKIVPMRHWISEELERHGLTKTPGVVEQWIGISWDEARRMKDSDAKYITHRWPLIDLRMTRHDCEKWLLAHGLEVPPKSACTFCPYHNTAEWRRIMGNQQDRAEAVAVDRAIRNARPPYQLFVHPARKPLEDVDLRTQEEKGQLSLWDNECSGICGI